MTGTADFFNTLLMPVRMIPFSSKWEEHNFLLCCTSSSTNPQFLSQTARLAGFFGNLMTDGFILGKI